MVANRIRHTVAFTLSHRQGSAEERDFLQAAESLATIPGVEAFELLDAPPALHRTSRRPDVRRPR